jgi:hypothetical protein
MPESHKYVPLLKIWGLNSSLLPDVMPGMRLNAYMLFWAEKIVNTAQVTPSKIKIKTTTMAQERPNPMINMLI